MDSADELEPHYRSPVRELAREVLIRGPVLRSQLARRLGLSLATVTRLSKPLIDGGLLVELDESADGAMGRPAKPLDVRGEAGWFLGIKLTGDAALAVTTDLHATEGQWAERPLPNHDVEVAIEAVVELAKELANGREFTAVGISLGGRVVRQTLVEYAPFLGWRDVDLGKALAARLGVPVIVENDVVALMAAEHWFGLARGLSKFAVITVGAGVGYGLVMHDEVVKTTDTGLGVGGGHIPLDANGPLCSLGHRGCSTAMLTIQSICGQVEVGIGEPVTYEQVLELAAEGNPVAREVMRAAGRALGRLISAAAYLGVVQHVVLAGEGLGLLSVAGDDVKAAMKADRDPDASEIVVLVDDRNFTSWARGAAAVAIQSTLDALATSTFRSVPRG